MLPLSLKWGHLPPESDVNPRGTEFPPSDGDQVVSCFKGRGLRFPPGSWELRTVDGQWPWRPGTCRHRACWPVAHHRPQGPFSALTQVGGNGCIPRLGKPQHGAIPRHWNCRCCTVSPAQGQEGAPCNATGSGCLRMGPPEAGFSGSKVGSLWCEPHPTRTCGV